MPKIAATPKWTQAIIHVPGERPVRRSLFSNIVDVSEGAAKFLIDRGFATACDRATAVPSTSKPLEEKKAPAVEPNVLKVEEPPSPKLENPEEDKPTATIVSELEVKIEAKQPDPKDVQPPSKPSSTRGNRKKPSAE